jgi:hypothetical protein
MRGRSCGSLLVMWLLLSGSPPELRGQTSADSATGLRGQQVSARQQRSAGPDSFPFPPGPGHYPGSAPTTPITFQQIVRASGTIFAGTVTKIEPGPARGGTAIPTVAVTFRVQRPLRGTAPGQSFSILEWLGLWTAGQRYVLGEHVLLFLYPPSKLGLTSAVAGPIGRFNLDPAGRILLSEQQSAVFRADLPPAGHSLEGQSSIGFNDLARALRRAGAQDVTQ